MDLIILYCLMFFHWVGDFILQTQEMAKNKSKSVKWLTAHVLVYTAVMSVGFIFIANTFLDMVFAITLIFATHWITDFLTSKATSKLWNNENVHGFFVMIGFDQWLHLIQITAIAYFCLS